MFEDVVIANKTYAKINIENMSGVDDIAIKVIRQDSPDFLLPMKMIAIDGEMEIRYEISEGTRLNYLPETMTKREFLTLLKNMLQPLKECNDWFLNCCNFWLDKNYIMVGKNYANVRYIYIPDDSYTQSEEMILNFFRDFILTINLNDDPMYVVNLYRHIKEKNTTIVNVLDYVEQENGKYVMPSSAENKAHNSDGNSEGAMKWTAGDEPKKEDAGKNVKKDEKESKSVEFGKADVQNELIGNLFGDSEEKEKNPKNKSAKEKKEQKSQGIFRKILGGKSNSEKNVVEAPGREKEVKKKPKQPAASVEAKPQECYESDDTTISEVQKEQINSTSITLQLEEDKGYHFPKYIELNLSGGNVTIGRYDKAGNPQSDYNFDASLSFISRRHCRIEKQGEEYFVIDLGSGNGTMLNNEVLVANMPYPLKAGDRIIFSKNQRITYRVC